MKTLLYSVMIGLLCACAFGQTTTTPPSTQLQNVTLPTYVFMGVSYNQFATPSVAGVFSALEPESQDPTSIFHNMLASESIDLLPLKYTDPVTKKTGYVFSGSFRFGQHKVVLNTAKPQPVTDSSFHPSFQLAVGADAGAAFSSTQATPSSISVGFSGSFTVSGFYHFKQHWAAGVAVRALYMSGIGPSGSAAWNPVIEPGLVYAK